MRLGNKYDGFDEFQINGRPITLLNLSELQAAVRKRAHRIPSNSSKAQVLNQLREILRNERMQQEMQNGNNGNGISGNGILNNSSNGILGSGHHNHNNSNSNGHHHMNGNGNNSLNNSMSGSSGSNSLNNSMNSVNNEINNIMNNNHNNSNGFVNNKINKINNKRNYEDLIQQQQHQYNSYGSSSSNTPPGQQQYYQSSQNIPQQQQQTTPQLPHSQSSSPISTPSKKYTTNSFENKALELESKILNYVNFTTVVQRLNVTESIGNRLVVQFTRFIVLKVLDNDSLDTKLSASKLVNKFWSYFILDTLKYEEFCNFLKFKIHYNPNQVYESYEIKKQRYKKTLELLEFYWLSSFDTEVWPSEFENSSFSGNNNGNQNNNNSSFNISLNGSSSHIVNKLNNCNSSSNSNNHNNNSNGVSYNNNNNNSQLSFIDKNDKDQKEKDRFSNSINHSESFYYQQQQQRSITPPSNIGLKIPTSPTLTLSAPNIKTLKPIPKSPPTSPTLLPSNNILNIHNLTKSSSSLNFSNGIINNNNDFNGNGINKFKKSTSSNGINNLINNVSEDDTNMNGDLNDDDDDEDDENHRDIQSVSNIISSISKFHTSSSNSNTALNSPPFHIKNSNNNNNGNGGNENDGDNDDEENDTNTGDENSNINNNILSSVSGGDCITLRCLSQGDEKHFKVNKFSPFSIFINSYKEYFEKQNPDPEGGDRCYRFLFQGCRLSESQTPYDLQMINGDVINIISSVSNNSYR
ncbi:hypothetical protein DICPUDRAFT_84807 [Dictyostelium purpureum]|uniref:Ubiquitin-like domain-containing protein n=1 Tax=Dictyostelium purpureum TaxID=5786 RepID=F1A3T1_DICPU|nr:uncharacterized protein DICPUDRAFT_84807 [Dictyostelium purpureum]EGC29144.1 hypothetical protein DICPUDRAFT_84807 [Dictyostelium purpureum]|eukprot:XP_003294325.1 hypothetical protein DICPUDRAFT_84807 [Dictyostelium purpureum]